MSTALYKNNATTTLSGGISNVATAIPLAAGSGVLFPAPGAGQFFIATLTDAATGLQNEIVKVTNITGDTATVVRAQEGTTAQAWSAGDNFSQLLTAGGCTGFSQILGVQSGVYNYALAISSGANAYLAAMVPAVTAYMTGAVYRVQFPATNTAATTIDLGAGAVYLRRPTMAMQWHDLNPSLIYTLAFDGVGFEVLEFYGASQVNWAQFPDVAVPSDGAFHNIANVGALTNGGRAQYLVDLLGSASASWSGLLNAVQFGPLVPYGVTQQNTPGAIAFQMSGAIVQMSITGGSGGMVATIIQQGA